MTGGRPRAFIGGLALAFLIAGFALAQPTPKGGTPEGAKLKNPPKIFHVNWFRRDGNGKFLWPGYGENVRVLKWMLDRIEGRAGATETPIGNVPAPGSLLLDGLSISLDKMGELLRVEANDWVEEEQAIGQFFATLGNRLPDAMRHQHLALAERLTRSTVPVK